MALDLRPSPPHGKVLLWELMGLRETQAGKDFLQGLYIKSVFTLIGVNGIVFDYSGYNDILKC